MQYLPRITAPRNHLILDHKYRCFRDGIWSSLYTDKHKSNGAVMDPTV